MLGVFLLHGSYRLAQTGSDTQAAGIIEKVELSYNFVRKLWGSKR
jgi:hypothetical protein